MHSEMKSSLREFYVKLPKVAMSRYSAVRSRASTHVQESLREQSSASTFQPTSESLSRSAECPCPSLRAPAEAVNTLTDSMPTMCCPLADQDCIRWRIAAVGWCLQRWRWWDWECWVQLLPWRLLLLDSVMPTAVCCWAAGAGRFVWVRPNCWPTAALARLRMRSCPSDSSSAELERSAGAREVEET